MARANKTPKAEPEEALTEAQVDFEAAFEKIRPTKVKKEEPDFLTLEAQMAEIKKFMYSVAEKDMALNEAGKPAVEKLKNLNSVLDKLNNTNNHELLLDSHILEHVKLWLEPLPDGSLTNITVTKALLEVLETMPVEIDHLRESGIGKIILFISKCPREPTELRKKATILVNKWSRIILGRSSNYRDITRETPQSAVKKRKVAVPDRFKKLTSHLKKNK